MPNPEPIVILYESDFEIGHSFDAGRSGKSNEDMYGIFPIRHNSPDKSFGVVDIQVAVVADGIGGSAGGEIASKMTVREIQKYLQTSEQDDDLRRRLWQSILNANSQIYQEAQAKQTLAGMGSTVVVVAIFNGQLHAFHAGDSRVYLLRNGELHLLTQDHSWVQEAVEAGRLTPTEAVRHPSRNVIRRYLGVDTSLDVDTQIVDISKGQGGTSGRQPMVESMRLQPGDTLLLCTDGLNDVVADKDLERVLSSTDPQGAAEKLVRMANAGGGPDNITAVVLRWKSDGAVIVPAKKPAKWLLFGLLPILLILLLGAGAVFAGWIPGFGNNVQEPMPTLEMVLTPEPPAVAELPPTPTPTEATTANLTPIESTPQPVEETPTVVVMESTVISNTEEVTGSLPISQTAAPLPEEATETPTSAPTATSTATLAPTSTPTPRATRTPTPSRVPTDPPTPFVMSTAVVPPTDTSTPTIAPTRPRPVASTPTPVITPGSISVGTVSLIAPPNGHASSGSVQFSWTSSHSLKNDEAYELVFWKKGQDPFNDGKGVTSPTTNTSTSVNFDNHAWVTPGSYLWGINLVRTVPSYQSIRNLGGSMEFTVSGGPQQAPAPSPTAPLPTATSTTVVVVPNE